MLLLAACHLPLAWWILERNWERVADVSRFGAATATTLTLVTSCVALDATRLAVPIVAFALELAAMAALAWWHKRLLDREAMEDFVLVN